MVGIELVTDRKDKTPAKAETAVLFEKLRGMPIKWSIFQYNIKHDYKYVF